MTRIGVGIVIADREGVLTDVSPIAAALLNAGKEELVGRTPEKTSAFARQLLLIEGAKYVQATLPAGEKRVCWVESHPLSAKDGAKGGTLWIICDASQTEKTARPTPGKRSGAPRDLNNKLGDAGNFHLTRRQLQVLVLVADGNTYKEVAARLGIGERTVKYHIQSAIDKLHLQNRLQLISYAAKSGLLK